MLSKLDNSFEDSSLGFAIFLIATIGPLLGVIIHCVYNIYIGNGLETYNLVIMDHPVLTSLNVSYIEVLIADAVTLVLLLAGLVIRHNYYKDERDFIRKYNLKGKTGFTSDMKGGRFSSRDDDFGGGGGDWGD